MRRRLASRLRSLAPALLAALVGTTAAWAGAHVGRATATPANLLGADGRYTLLFLGSDKRCSGYLPGDTAERCPSLEALSDENPGDARYRASSANDAALGLQRRTAGGERTDVMTLLTIDPYAGTAAALSIPRDTMYFPLKPTLAKQFCSSGRKTFGHKVNALFVYAQLCMPANRSQRLWDRSSSAAALVRENLAWALNVEIDDWVLGTFGAADIFGAKLDAYAAATPDTADDTTYVRLNADTMFAACRTDVYRDWTSRSGYRYSSRYYADVNLASNARYGDLLYVRPDGLDRRTMKKDGRNQSVSAAEWGNCAEPGSDPLAPATTVPNFVGDDLAGPAQCQGAAPTSGCLFTVPSSLWTAFGRTRKYDGDGARVRRHQRLIAGIALRVLDAGKPAAELIAGLASLRWYYTVSSSGRKNAGPALVRGSIDPASAGALYDLVATVRTPLEIGPDAAGGWRSMVIGGGTAVVGGKSCRLAGASGAFTLTRKALPGILACTRGWVATAFGPTSHAGSGVPTPP